jgi:cytochrome c-type biogenesis protein CcmH/NrfF
MSRLKSSLLLLAVSALCLAQTGTEVMTPEVRRVGDKLACLCGICNNTVGTCPMLRCEHAYPARQRLAKALAIGKSDDQIVKAEVKMFGLRALSGPPTEGFSLLAWVMPMIAVAIGLGVVALVFKRLRGRPAIAGAPEIDADLLDRYHDQIEKEVAKLE